MCRLIGIDTNFDTRIMVAEIKAGYIANILEKAQICRNISNIFLFGSVLKEECTEESDIDLCSIAKQNGVKVPRAVVRNAQMYTDWEAAGRYDLHFSVRIDSIEKAVQIAESWIKTLEM